MSVACHACLDPLSTLALAAVSSVSVGGFDAVTSSNEVKDEHASEDAKEVSNNVIHQ